MSNIKEKVANRLGITEEKDMLNEKKYFESSDIMPVIKELGELPFAKGKKKQIKASKMFMKIAESDELCSNMFMRDIDKATAESASKLVKKINEKYFKIKNHKKV